MKALSLAGALAVALTFGSAMALAQSDAHVGDGKNSITPPSLYNTGGAAAKVGDGTNSSVAPYSYNFGGSAAHIGDGSNSTTATYPYNVGGGSAAKSSTETNYKQGAAQSLAPPPGMATTENSSK